MFDSTLSRSFSAPRVSADVQAYWILRWGAALCFVGHGAFGFITKAAWVPYFGVVAIPEAWAWRLMPVVGAVDVLAGMAVLFAPRALPLLYMAVWGLWTALLRPLAGESLFETLERAGNYGVPAALLVMTAAPRSVAGLLTPLAGPSRDPAAIRLAGALLRWTTALLLAGHGALGAFHGKVGLQLHYAAAALPPNTVTIVGWFELALAALVAARPMVGVLVFIAAWKLATESLFLLAGAPLWEVVERGGSYAAPLALAMLRRDRQSTNTG